MPYLVLDTPGATADFRTLALESLEGDELLPATSREFFFQSGIDGLGIPPREIVTRRIPGMDGAKIREIRTGVREIFLPLFLDDDSSHVQYLDDLDALEEMFDYRNKDYAGQDGTLTLVAFSDRGERRLRCAYQGGMETGYGTDDEGNTWASLGLKFLCVQPYWYGESWSTPTVTRAEALPWFDDFPPSLSPSVAFGPGIEVEVLGRAPSWPTVDLTGPADEVTITGTGFNLTVPDGLADGEAATIVSRPGSRTAIFGGTRDWSRVGPNLQWQALTPGAQTLSISMTGAGSATSARVSGMSLYERPW